MPTDKLCKQSELGSGDEAGVVLDSSDSEDSIGCGGSCGNTPDAQIARGGVGANLINRTASNFRGCSYQFKGRNGHGALPTLYCLDRFSSR